MFYETIMFHGTNETFLCLSTDKLICFYELYLFYYNHNMLKKQIKK